MTKLSDILDGLVKTFTMDDPKNCKPQTIVCRECEIVGSAACFSGAAYMIHVTRMGKIMLYPGMLYACLLGTFGLALLISPAPSKEYEEVLTRIKADRAQQNDFKLLEKVEDKKE